MSSPAKAKGTRTESAVRDYLQSRGIPARRVAQTGQLDTGDIHGVSPFVLQVKNYANVTEGLRLGVEGAKVQAPRAGEPFGAAVIKRARKPISDAYVAMDLETFARLLGYMGAMSTDLDDPTIPPVVPAPRQT